MKREYTTVAKTQAAKPAVTATAPLASSRLQVKVIPGASRDRICGKLGDAIKIQVSAAPERGKANNAVINLIADLLGLRTGEVQVLRGHSQPRKVLQINGIDQPELERRISDLL